MSDDFPTRPDAADDAARPNSCAYPNCCAFAIDGEPYCAVHRTEGFDKYGYRERWESWPAGYESPRMRAIRQAALADAARDGDRRHGGTR